MAQIRRKVFISYHHDDQDEVENFIDTFDDKHDVFIARTLGVTGDIINSNDTDYVMSRIRQLYLGDSTVTIVLVGRCTWARRYVDWEIQASLRSGTTVTPNGLIGIALPSASQQPHAPERLSANLEGTNYSAGYARYYWYPQSKDTLAGYIEDAFTARTTRSHLIENPRERFANNKQCP